MIDIIVYTEQITSRVQYSCKVLFEILLGLKFNIVDDSEEFISSNLPKINYSKTRLTSSEIQIPPVNLLFEKNITPQIIEIDQHKNLPIFFKASSIKSDLPFDLLSMTFYLVSRYEEYLPFGKDKFGRFSAKESLAKQSGFLHQPLINHWSVELGELLKEKFPDITINLPKFKFESTFDIDYAWAFQNRGIKRTVIGYGGDIVKRRSRTLKKRLQTHFFGKKDPYQVFDYLEKIHQQYQIQPTWFFLLGDEGPYDQNISHKNISFQKLIQNISGKYKVGIHPSMRSNNSFTILQKEKNRLEKIVGKEVIKSRQHFLILKFPETYRNLLKAGIKEDYTMGYADDIGFRASIATPFPWFDLMGNVATDLRIHPFQVMDGTLNFLYLGLSKEEALSQTKTMIKTTQKIGGTFCLLWHNSTLSDLDEWNGWFNLYEEILNSS